MLKARTRRAGNAIMEYAVPTILILVGSGILATNGQIRQVLDDYFLRASNHTSGNVSGNVLQTDPNPPAGYAPSNGSSFTSYGTVN